MNLQFGCKLVQKLAKRFPTIHQLVFRVQIRTKTLTKRHLALHYTERPLRPVIAYSPQTVSGSSLGLYQRVTMRQFYFWLKEQKPIDGLKCKPSPKIFQVEVGCFSVRLQKIKGPRAVTSVDRPQ
jgi:hypothetical protein